MTWSISQKRFARLVLYVIGVATIIFIVLPFPAFRNPVRVASSNEGHYLRAIRNVTLGVEKIFVINLPTRPDKRDSIILGSSISNFHVDWIDGVTPDQISALSYPYVSARIIVDKGLGSAIIMEDDADWDVTVKTQLQSLAIAVRALQGTSPMSTASPYGDDWDILWLGHCGIECQTNSSFFLTPRDPTILPPHHFLPYWREPPPIERPDHARLTCTASDGACSIVYAVSYRGARKILSALSVNPTGIAEQIDIGAQFDVSLGRMCGNGYLRCFATYPSLTGGYITSSDIHDSGESKERSRERPSSSGVMYSTLLNINRILHGEPTVHSTWDDAATPDIRPDSIAVLGGTLQVPEENGLREIPFDSPS
ncbi:hypothetical protein EYZ11_011620 [Aspergillus tanneri]|uniref:Uncharacterized protein n=1 Tax=Aspergillus tanneri TaxID=1220188 RepID=A0A4S3J2B8_9EURO|nr:hypothetical protein EYZ11_011620 [Aspergillus tanneri]